MKFPGVEQAEDMPTKVAPTTERIVADFIALNG